MKIYVDFDDCLCETAEHFSKLVERLFGKNVPYEDIRYFNLQKSFSLTEEQYEYMMIEGHKPESLLAYDETPGAVMTLNGFIDKDKLMESAKAYGKSPYGEHLKAVAEGRVRY